MNDQQVMHAMHIDDSYETQRVLAEGVGGRTELVTVEGAGPFVRKKMPVELARRRVWSTLAECSCSRLPHVEVAYELPEQFVVVYDFVPGQTLESMVKGPQAADGSGLAGSPDVLEGTSQARPLERDVAVRLACEVCEAAQALHDHGVVHRDISPTNVVVSADGAHLIDLGIARMRVEGASRDTASLGTWGFASPEQYGFAQTDARSDVYSIGRLLGFALTGVTPGDAAYDAALRDPALVAPGLRAIVERACAFEPSSRYQSARDLACALNRAEVAGEGGASEDCAGRDGESAGGQASGDATGMRDAAPKARGGAAHGETAGAAPTQGRTSEKRSRAPLVAVAAIAIAAVCCVAGWAAVQDALHSGNPEASQSEGASAGKADASGGSAGEADEGSSSTSGSALGSPSSASPSASSGSAVRATSSPLEVVESGWSCDSTGYVHYAFALRNGADEAIEFPTVRIVGKGADGSVLFSEEKPLMVIGAGQTAMFASQAGDGQVPATVEFEPLEPRTFNVGSRTDVPTYAVSDVVETHDRYGGTKFTGWVEMTDGQADDDMVAISVVLRDGSGAIVGGYNGFATCGKVGQRASFEVLAQNAPEHASFETYAQQW